MKKWFFFSDMQMPLHDEKAVDLAFKFMSWFKPDVVVNIGDLVDGTGTSRWADGSTEEVFASIINENKHAQDYWKRVRKARPRARLIWTLGNHDIRPFEYVDKKAPALRELVTYDSLWNASELGVEIYPYNKPPEVKMGDVYIHHGVAVSKHSGDSARADVESWGVSIVRGHCFSSDTEILTVDGWKKYDEIEVGTSVYTLNTSTGLGEYQKVSEKFVYSDYEKMISIKGRTIDALVTHEHQMISKGRTGFVRCTAEELAQNSSSIIPLAAESNLPDANISDESLKMISWIMAERNFDKYRLRVLGEESEWVYEHIDPKTKAPIGEMLKLSARQAQLFLMEYMWYDVFKNNAPKNSYIETNNDKIKDYLQALAVTAGWRSSSIRRPRNMWRITINTTNFTKLSNRNFAEVNYSGDVWCVTVPNHTLVVRRNGKTFIAGNSHRLGSYHKTYELRDEALSGYEIGHLMDVDKAEYTQVHNWQQGFAVGYEDEGVGVIDPIRILPDYSCYYGGKKFALS